MDMVTLLPGFAIGSEFTITLLLVLFVHKLTAIPVTVYVVVITGLAATVAPVVISNPLTGSQEYVFAPLAIKFVLAPRQMLAELTATTGKVFTVTAVIAVPEQPPGFPVTVYDAGAI